MEASEWKGPSPNLKMGVEQTKNMIDIESQLPPEEQG
jgi:hypothetical protein